MHAAGDLEIAARPANGMSVDYQGNHESPRNIPADIEEKEHFAYEPFRPVNVVLNPDS